MSPRTSRRGLRVLQVTGIAMLTGGLALFAVQAQAAFTAIAETGRPGYLQLAWGPEPQQISGLRAGEDYYWQIRTSLQDAPHGDLTLTLRADGGLVDHHYGLTLAIDGCDRPFDDVPAAPACGEAPTSILATTKLSEVAQATSGDVWALADIGEHRQRYLLVRVSTPAAGLGDPGLQGLEARVGFGLSSSGDSPAAPARILPVTGTDLLSLLLIAVGMMLALPAGWALRRARGVEGDRDVD